MIKHGPVDLIIVAAAEAHFDGSVFGALEEQVDKGTIRVLDAMLLVKDADGTTWSMDLEDLPEDLKGALGFVETGTRGLFDSEDSAALYEGMVPGSAVFAMALEHTWAIPLVNAFADAGVELAFNARVPAPLVDEAFASLEMQA